MGINYYLKKKKCKCCGLRDEKETIHIGKGSVGWSFSFHGIPGEIETERDWRDLMKSSEDMEIVDEYGTVHSYKDFWDFVLSKTKLKNHTTYCRNSDEAGTKRHGFEECWYDSETGSSFSKGEFS